MKDCKSKRQIVFCSILLLPFHFLLNSSLTAQDSKSKQLFILWQQRVETLTDGVVDDISSLEHSESSVYFALLAKIWWKTNPELARSFLQKSVGAAITALESDEKSGSRLKNFQKTLQIISDLDQKTSEKLFERFVEAIDNKSGNNEQIADMLVVVAIQSVERNPTLAYELGMKSFSFGTSFQIAKLIGELNVKDARLSQNLYIAALRNAEIKYSLRAISRLSVTAFTNYKGKTQSDIVRRTFLSALSQLLSRAFVNESERKSACEFAIVASSVTDQFEKYLPEQLPVVRQQIQICIAVLPKFSAGLVEADLKDKTDDVEELIKKARETNDQVTKLTFYYRAFTKLEQKEKFEEIISYLNSVTDDEKEILGINTLGNSNWESWYSQYSVPLAKQYLAAKDLAGAYRVINRAQKKIRPTIRLNLVYELPLDENRSFILENLEETRKDLSALDISAVTRAGYFLALTKLYIKIQPTEAEGVFREAIKSINGADKENPDFLPEKDYAPLKDYISLPSKLLEIDEISIFNSFQDLSSRRSRARLKLGLLESSLVNYVNEKKRLEEENKKAAKKAA